MIVPRDYRLKAAFHGICLYRYCNAHFCWETGYVPMEIAG